MTERAQTTARRSVRNAERISDLQQVVADLQEEIRRLKLLITVLDRDVPAGKR